MVKETLCFLTLLITQKPADTSPAYLALSQRAFSFLVHCCADSDFTLSQGALSFLVHYCAELVKLFVRAQKRLDLKAYIISFSQAMLPL